MLPSNIGQLTSLTSLDLANTQLYGIIPLVVIQDYLIN
jgi:hypothetical protein